MCCAAARRWAVQGGPFGRVWLAWGGRSLWPSAQLLVSRPSAGPPVGGGSPAAVVSSPPLRMAGHRVTGVWLCAGTVGPVAGCNSGSWGFLTRRTRVLRRVPKISCTKAVCCARAFVSVRMAVCCRSPSASARTWWIAVFDNTPAVTGSAVGPACMAGPFARSLVDSLRGRGGSGGMPGPGVALPPFPVAGGSRGSGKCGPRPGACGRRSLGLHSCRTPWAATAGLHRLGVRCTCGAG